MELVLHQEGIVLDEDWLAWNSARQDELEQIVVQGQEGSSVEEVLVPVSEIKFVDVDEGVEWVLLELPVTGELSLPDTGSLGVLPKPKTQSREGGVVVDKHLRVSDQILLVLDLKIRGNLETLLECSLNFSNINAKKLLVILLHTLQKEGGVLSGGINPE